MMTATMTLSILAVIVTAWRVSILMSRRARRDAEIAERLRRYAKREAGGQARF